MNLLRNRRDLIVIVVIVTLSGSAGVAAYTLSRPKPPSPVRTTATPTTTADAKKSSKPQSTTATQIAPTPSAAPTQPTTTTQPSKTTAPPPPATTPAPTTSPIIFYAGRIDTAYTSCSYGVLSYTLGGVTISVNQVTSTPFSWQIELNDGTIFESSADVMPTGKTIWFNFPSTPDYPSMIGTVTNADDGDMARLVITKPSYSAGGWSSPVPAGSFDACRNGQI